MTATTKTIRSASLGDRYAELSVLVVTVIALALGWWLKTGVENRGLPFSAAGITAQTPAGWLVSKASGEEVLHVTDRTAKGFGTTYLIQQMPAAADANLGGVAGMLTLQRGSELTAYKVLNQQNVSIGGRQAVEI